MLDFLIPHETAHNLQRIHSQRYDIPLLPEQFDDLKKSKHLTPEIFSSGANELATDVIALRLGGDKEHQRKSAQSLLVLLEQDMAKEKAGEYEPFFRDQARFETLLAYLDRQQLLSEADKERVSEVINFWRNNRREQLDEEDQKRFEQLKEYLLKVIKKAKEIKEIEGEEVL